MVLKLKVIISTLLLLQLSAFAQLRQIETPHMVLIYPSEEHSYLIPYAVSCYENALSFHQNLLDYHSQEKTTVFLQDFWDYGNAGATAVPDNYIRIGIAPLNYTFETSPANERINHTFNHELVHVIASDKASASDNFFRGLFSGKVYVTPEDPLSMYYSYLTNPRRYSPRWYHEGIAVFMETWMAAGIGRALGSYDEMVFRTMVLDSAYIYNVIGLESEGTTIDFQVGVNSYLYGTRFMSYIAYIYSPQKLIEWISAVKERNSFFSTDFKRIYGLPLQDAWNNWIRWEKSFQAKNLNLLRSHPLTNYRKISQEGLGSVSRAFYDNKTEQLYVAILYPGQTAHIAAIDVKNGNIRKLTDVDGPGLFYVTSLTWDRDRNKLFFSTDNSNWRDLYQYDLNSGESKKLMDDVRTGDLAFNRQDSSLWGVRHYNGISTLVQIPYPYKKWLQVYSFPYGSDIYDIDISPDGKLVTAALAKISGQQLLIKMNVDSVKAGNQDYDIIFDFENSIPANFSFSDDGKFLFGSSYYSGVSNIYRYNVESANIVALSNCETGFFRPTPVSEDSLIVFRYSGEGFTPAMIANDSVQYVSAISFLGNELVQKHPVLKEWVAGSPAAVNIDSLTVSAGDYKPMKSLMLRSAYPVVEGYKNSTALGLRFDVLDRLGITSIKAKLSYTPETRLAEKERIHALLQFNYFNWSLTATHNQADFYDLFGPTKNSRKGNKLGLSYNEVLLDERPRRMDLNLNLALFTNLERLPAFQKINVTVNSFYKFGASFSHSNLQKTLGAEDYEKGWGYELTSYNYLANEQLFPHLLANLNYGFLLPLKHSSLWLRSSAGISRGSRTISFSNFYFGGFGNNWIDHQNARQFHEYYSFPGAGLNSISGQNFAKLLTEWTLPPLKFRHMGSLGLYLNWTRLSLFSSAIMTDVNKASYRTKVANLGAQLDFKLAILTYMSATLSVGYAKAVDESHSLKNASDEFMISLKIL